MQGLTPAQIAASPFDVRVVDPHDRGGSAWTPEQIRVMGAGTASPHLVLGSLNIGEAQSQRSYFRAIPRAALGPASPHAPAHFAVAFWAQPWRVMAMRSIDQLIRTGYDGVCLDAVDACHSTWARSQGVNPMAAMAALVTDLAGYARARRRGFKVWAMNGEALLASEPVLAGLDGLFRENLYVTAAGRRRPAEEIAASLALLKRMIAAGKDVIAVERVDSAEMAAAIDAAAERDGLGSYIGRLEPGAGAESERGNRPPVPAPRTPPVPPRRRELGEPTRGAAAFQPDTFTFGPAETGAMPHGLRPAPRGPVQLQADSSGPSAMGLYLQRSCGADHPDFRASR
ncbi:endo alpha-1,4 polygalactosaminidase [Methylobacterium nigriterrae]|uniref:endo alpha-1,4 polygalactosaminidase n=1 Tax=Methylobacterium nigriterrae TaxID=3127512 RepID=UPI003013F5D2